MASTSVDGLSMASALPMASASVDGFRFFRWLPLCRWLPLLSMASALSMASTLSMGSTLSMDSASVHGFRSVDGFRFCRLLLLLSMATASVDGFHFCPCSSSREMPSFATALLQSVVKAELFCQTLTCLFLLRSAVGVHVATGLLRPSVGVEVASSLASSMFVPVAVSAACLWFLNLWPQRRLALRLWPSLRSLALFGSRGLLCCSRLQTPERSPPCSRGWPCSQSRTPSSGCQPFTSP